MPVTYEEFVSLINKRVPPHRRGEAYAHALEIYGPKPQPPRFESYKYTPDKYISEILGWSPWEGQGVDQPGQQEVLDAYVLSLRQQHEKRDFENGTITESELQYWKPDQIIKNIIRVEAGHTVGKCIAENEFITAADGSRIAAKELIGRSFDIPTLDADGSVITTKALAGDNGMKPVFEILTDTGKIIKRTGNHPLWRTEAVFRAGSRPIIPEGDWCEAENLKCGDLVAVPEELPIFGKRRIPDHEVKLIAYLIGDGGISQHTVRFSQPESPQLDEYKDCADTIGCRLVKLNDYDYIAYAKTPRTSKWNSNPLMALMRKHELMGKTSQEKRIPKEIFQLPKKKLQIFLSRLFSTDGWASVDKNQQREIGYCSTSEGLIRDIGNLLQRFGVHCRIKPRNNATAWTLVIKDASDQLRFIDEIGIFGKETAVENVARLAHQIVAVKTRNIAERPNRPRWCHKNAKAGTRWEKIVSVKEVGVERTVAIEVPIYDTYLTEFYEHNTKLSSGLVNHFLDCFVPSIIYTFAPTWDQIKDLLWKEIEFDREGKKLPGKILKNCKIDISSNHFARGRATQNSNNRGTERVQGQHNEYLMFVLDEAEGVADFVYGAVDSMISGGIAVVLLLANPKTRTSKFHKIKKYSNVQSFRISCLHHPNVIAGREVIPGAVKRDYVRSMTEKHCEVVNVHNEDNYTFTLPFDVLTAEKNLVAGTIFQPNAEYLFRVLGIAPANLSDKNPIVTGRYDSAVKRTPSGGDKTVARIGVDVARFGKDSGTIYIRWQDAIWRSSVLSKLDTDSYWNAVRTEALKLHAKGVTSLHVRIDGGGGFGGNVVDRLSKDDELIKAFKDFEVFEVHFNGTPYDIKSYYDTITELYFEAAESLKTLCVISPPEALEIDLTEREFDFRNVSGRTVKKLESKDDFKKRKEDSNSPDDGDGFVLAAGPDHCFNKASIQLLSPNFAGQPATANVNMVDELAKLLGG